MALFITGHDRSGTTLLQKICNQHPEMAVTNEFGSFIHLGLSYWAYSKHMLGRWIQVRNRFFFDREYMTKDMWRFSNLAFNTSFILCLYQYRRSRITVGDVEATMKRMYSQTKVVGDKRTLYMDHLRRLVGSEGLTGIIIYRDCRDVTNSFLRMARTSWKKQGWIENLNTASAVAKRWVKYIELMEQYEGQLYAIRYEELVQEPCVELAALGDWLGVAPDGFPFTEVRASSIGKYRQGLTGEELDRVLEIAGPTLARYGYI